MKGGEQEYTLDLVENIFSQAKIVDTVNREGGQGRPFFCMYLFTFVSVELSHGGPSTKKTVITGKVISLTNAGRISV